MTTTAVEDRLSRLLPFVSLAFGISAVVIAVPLWVISTGPHVDTGFEYLRLARTESLGDYLALVAEDNQPPGQMIVNWVVYHSVTSHLIWLRLAMGWISSLVIVATAAIYLRRLGSRKPVEGPVRRSSRTWMIQTGIFGLLLALSPGVLPVLTYLRYSTMMSLLWFLSWCWLLVFLRKPTARGAWILGVVTGFTLVASYSAIPLLILVVAAVFGRARSHVGRLLGGMAPGIVLAVLWATWAGFAFVSRITVKGSATNLDRLVALYENALWPLIGAASLPTPSSLVLAVGAGMAFVLLGWLGWKSQREAFVLVASSLVVSAVIFSAAGIVNGNMAAPTLPLILLVATLVDASETSHSIQLVAFIVLVLAWSSATIAIWNAHSVLRPFKYSNATDEAVDTVDVLRLRSPSTVIDVGEWSTQAMLLDRGIPYIDGRELSATDELPTDQVILLLGDDMDKSPVMAEARAVLSRQGFQLAQVAKFGGYDFAAVRDQLGLYNTDGSQYYVEVFKRAG